MQIQSIVVGGYATNCYFLIDESSGRCAVIDPGAQANRILAVLARENLSVDYILMTHGHDDHVGAVSELLERWPEAAVYMHHADFQEKDPELFPLRYHLSQVNHYSEGDRLQLGELEIQVMHTPGHSEGSVTLRCEQVLFTGDTLFAGSCGRTDFVGGSMPKIMASLKRLAQLEGDFQVLPGHMEDTTLEQERRTNPFLRQAMTRF